MNTGAVLYNAFQGHGGWALARIRFISDLLPLMKNLGICMEKSQHVEELHHM